MHPHTRLDWAKETAMPLTTQSFPFAGSPDLFNTGDSDHRVPIYQVLTAPSIAAVSTRHTGRVKHVPPSQMDALLVANQAIDDTWQILNRGSGNQRRHLISTEGDSFKRTMMARADYQKNASSWSDIAHTAARFEAGNCGEMAAVCALLCASSGINQPVSILKSSIHDHALAQIGDPRVSNKTVIVDAWPEFGRAIRTKDFTLLGPQPMAEHTYLPQYAAPQERNRLLYGDKVTQKQVDRDFAQLYPNSPKDGKKLVDHILLTAPTYAQQHGAKNLGQRYTGEDSFGRSHHLDLNLSEAQFKQRLIQLGLNPKNGKPTPGNRRPKTTPIDTLKRALGIGRARTASMSAASPAITVPWTAPAPVIPPAASAAYVRPRYASMTVAPSAPMPREERGRAPAGRRDRPSTADSRMPREERRRAPSADVRTRPVAEAEGTRTRRHASRDGHRMATQARREHADSFILTMRRLHSRDPS